jgi:hypothetical protein
MEKVIACCGINCATCDARIATLTNDNQLRAATAEKWQKMYHAAEITAESINCTGCRETGAKFNHCSVCGIRNCVTSKGFNTCGDCPDMEHCEIVSMVHKYLPEAVENLKNLN